MGSSSRLTVLCRLGWKGCPHANGSLLLQSAPRADRPCLLVFHTLKSSSGTRLSSRSTARLAFSLTEASGLPENGRTNCISSGISHTLPPEVRMEKSSGKWMEKSLRLKKPQRIQERRRAITTMENEMPWEIPLTIILNWDFCPT